MIKSNTILGVAVCVTALSISLNGWSASPAGLVDLTYAAEKAVPAVVHIKVKTNSQTRMVEVQDPWGDFFSDPFGFFGNPGGGGSQRRQVQTPPREASGSGVIITNDGYIVTNNHVVDGADEITVTLNDNREFAARIIGTDKTTDLALIKVDSKNLPFLTVGDSDKLKVGEWVIAVGNPFNLNSTVTAGIVSAKARSLYANGVESFIQTDAAINSGNSGGALVDANAKLIGIVTAIASADGYYTGYSFAIPANLAKKVSSDLKRYGAAQRAYLGVQVIEMNDQLAKQIGINQVKGVLIGRVVPNAAADHAGLKEGDLLLSVSGVEVNSFAEMMQELGRFAPGDHVNVNYYRDGKTHSTTVTLQNSQGTTEIIKR